MIEFAVTNRTIRYMDRLEEEGFDATQIKNIIRVTVEMMPGRGKEEIQQIMLRAWTKRYSGGII